MSAIRVAPPGRPIEAYALACVLWVLAALPAVGNAAVEDAWNASACAGCHLKPISPAPLTGRILLFLSERFSTSWCLAGHAGNGTQMCIDNGTYFSSPGATDLSGVYDFVVSARDTVVTGGAGAQVDGLPAFAATAFGSSRAQTITVTNYRSESLDFQPSITADAADFSVANSTCSVVSASPLTLRVGAATVPVADEVPTSCSMTVTFQPAVSTTAARSGNLQINYTAYTTAQPRQRGIALSGTADFPVYSPIGFAALTSPGFTAATNGSQTICRTISNTTTTTASLSIALSIGQAGGASADYSNYYELDSLGACSGGSPPLCVAAATSVAGSTSLAAGASCTLPIKFNPGKFGFAAGTGARSAQLTVTHNDPIAGQTAGYTLVGNVTSGPEPAIGISTTPGVDGSNHVLPPEFANQVLATTSAQWNQFHVYNVGSADGLGITSVTQTDAAEFALAENCSGASLAILSGGSPTCTIALTFTPNGLNQRCTTVTVHAAISSNGDQSVIVCGTGVPVPVAQMSLSPPAAIAFGNRSIGAVYQTVPLTIGNAASATAGLQIGAVALNGSGFAFVPDASACQNQTLAAGTSCTLQLQFTPDPNLPGVSYAANVTIASNDPTTPNASIALSATAVAYSVPVLQWQQIASTTLSFPGVVIAGQSSAQPLVARLANPDGPGAVAIQAVRLVGADASSFTATSCPALLYQGEFCDVSITFMPGSGGQKTAQLQVISSTGVAPALLTVQGQGVGGSSPYLIVSTGTLSFGGVRVGARSDPLVLTLAAGGDGALQVTSIAVPAPFSLASQTCPPVPFTLPVGADCSVTVTFAPTSTSDTSAKLSVGTDASAQPLEVQLDGVGQAPADVSSGGCSIAAGDTPTDPTLWALAALAVLGLIRRRRSRLARRLEAGNGRR